MWSLYRHRPVDSICQSLSKIALGNLQKGIVGARLDFDENFEPRLPSNLHTERPGVKEARHEARVWSRERSAATIPKPPLSKLESSVPLCPCASVANITSPAGKVKLTRIKQTSLAIVSTSSLADSHHMWIPEEKRSMNVKTCPVIDSSSLLSKAPNNQTPTRARRASI